MLPFYAGEPASEVVLCSCFLCFFRKITVKSCPVYDEVFFFHVNLYGIAVWRHYSCFCYFVDYEFFQLVFFKEVFYVSADYSCALDRLAYLFVLFIDLCIEAFACEEVCKIVSGRPCPDYGYHAAGNGGLLYKSSRYLLYNSNNQKLYILP